MLYVRGNSLDYDQWASQGNDGWSYADVLPYFIKSENNRGTLIDGKIKKKNKYILLIRPEIHSKN